MVRIFSFIFALSVIVFCAGSVSAQNRIFPTTTLDKSSSNEDSRLRVYEYLPSEDTNTFFLSVVARDGEVKTIELDLGVEQAQVTTILEQFDASNAKPARYRLPGENVAGADILSPSIEFTGGSERDSSSYVYEYRPKLAPEKLVIISFGLRAGEIDLTLSKAALAAE